MMGIPLKRASNGTFWAHAMASGEHYVAYPARNAAALEELVDIARDSVQFIVESEAAHRLETAIEATRIDA